MAMSQKEASVNGVLTSLIHQAESISELSGALHGLNDVIPEEVRDFIDHKMGEIYGYDDPIGEIVAYLEQTISTLKGIKGTGQEDD